MVLRAAPPRPIFVRGERVIRKLIWLLNGVLLGFVAAHFVNQTAEGRRFFDRLGRGVEEFGRAFSTGYHDAETEDAEFEAALRDLTTKR